MTVRLHYMHAAATFRIVLMRFYSKTRPYIHEVHRQHLITENERVEHTRKGHAAFNRGIQSQIKKKKTSNVNSSTRGTHSNSNSRDTENTN